MIIERNQNKRLIDPTNPERGQVVKITRAVKNEWCDALRKFARKCFNESRRRAETQTRTPFARVDCRQVK
jgi:hypothetical protein